MEYLWKLCMLSLIWLRADTVAVTDTRTNALANKAPYFDNVVPETITIGALLPADPKWPFSIDRMRQGANRAIQEVQKEHLLQPNLTVEYEDSNCSEADGMNQAINLYYHKKIHVLFGPICDYSAAPVARQVTFWNLPLVTVGGLAADFIERRKAMYPLLTRAGANLYTMASALTGLMRHHTWTQLKLLYVSEGQDYVIPHLCHLVGAAIVETMPSDKIDVNFHKIQANFSDPQVDVKIERILRYEVGMKYSGRIREHLLSIDNKVHYKLC